MIPIYVKLGPGYHEFYDETLDIFLDDTNPMGVLDYSNLSPSIFEALDVSRIVQIDEATFNGLVQTIDPDHPVQVTSDYLLTLSNYLQGCPDPTAVFFTLYNNHWYKIRWSDIKACMGSKLNLFFNIGVDVAPVPQPNDVTFQDNSLKGKDWKALVVTSNGLEIYHQSMYDPSEYANVDYYTLDNVTGTFGRPVGFRAGEKFRVRDI